MDFKTPYLLAMRERAPRMFNALVRSGQIEAHLHEKSVEANAALKAAMAGEPRYPGPDGAWKDATKRSMVEEIIFAEFIEFPPEEPLSHAYTDAYDEEEPEDEQDEEDEEASIGEEEALLFEEWLLDQDGTQSPNEPHPMPPFMERGPTMFSRSWWLEETGEPMLRHYVAGIFFMVMTIATSFSCAKVTLVFVRWFGITGHVAMAMAGIVGLSAAVAAILVLFRDAR